MTPNFRFVREEKNRPKKPLSAYSINVQTLAEELETLEHTGIHGSDIEGERLTTQILAQEQLFPRFKLRIAKDTTVAFSPIYELRSGRVATVAYVQHDRWITSRSFYRSNSHALWRLIPSYTWSKGYGINWYGKGHSETSITLPVVLQQALDRISAEAPALKVSRPDFIFAGSARNLGEKTQATYVHEVGSLPKSIKGRFRHDEYYGRWGRRQRLAPEKAGFKDKSLEPDFSKMLGRWDMNTSIYGIITVDIFPSFNGKLTYLFCSTDIEINDEVVKWAWIGGVQYDSPIGSSGVCIEWVEIGDLATPAFEYHSQSGDFGNNAVRNGHYIDMFTNYLSRMSVIQGFLERTRYDRHLLKCKTPEALLGTVERFPVNALGGKTARDTIILIKDVLSGRRQTHEITRANGLRMIVEGLASA